MHHILFVTVLELLLRVHLILLLLQLNSLLDFQIVWIYFMSLRRGLIDWIDVQLTSEDSNIRTTSPRHS